MATYICYIVYAEGRSILMGLSKGIDNNTLIGGLVIGCIMGFSYSDHMQKISYHKKEVFCQGPIGPRKLK